MPRPVISVDTIGRLQRTARSHESLADHLNTDEQLLLVLDRHDKLQRQVQQLGDRGDGQPAGDRLSGMTLSHEQQAVDLSSVQRRR